ncbi:MAG TPA: AAA family ATPase [Pseudomonadota bacterium]|jgi:hypothetical protein|nr:AAA family ATPase [Pseudomonadota bacterium]
MLVRFAVENFLSFGPRWQLDLRAPEGTESAPLGPILPDGFRVLPLALIVGDAATGKSNLLKALAQLRQLALHGQKPGQRASLPVCRLASPPRSDVAFAIEVFAQDALYRYELALRPEQVDAESLSVCVRGEPEQLVFRRERKNPILQLTDVKVGPGARSERGLWESLAVHLGAEQPLFAAALAEGSQVAAPFGAWLSEQLQLIRPEPRVTGLSARAAHHPAFAEKLAELLRGSGLPVTHVAARKTPIGPDYFENEEEQRQVVSALLGYPDAFVQTPDGELIAEREGNFVDLFLTSLQVGLRGPSGRESDFSPSELSETALRLLHLSPLAIPPGQSQPPVFFVDDLGRGLAVDTVNRLLSSTDRPATSQVIATATADSFLLRLVPEQAQRVLPALVPK